MPAATPRILVLGATGYTGDLTARALLAQGARPVLVARNQQRVEALADELGGLDTAVADVSDPATIRAVLTKGDVLISTVGPFLKYGTPAVQAAAEIGAHYLDSTGEGPFIRAVFERWGPIAERNGAALLTAFGYDYVPGAFAAALALEDAGPDATAVDIAYFSPGFIPSGGSQSSAVRVALDDQSSYTYRDGRIQHERAGRRINRYDIDGQRCIAASIPAVEHLSLPQSHPQLRDITVLGGFPQAGIRAIAIASPLSPVLSRSGPLKRGIIALSDRLTKGSTGGPDAEARAKATTHVVATARSKDKELARVELTGPNPYEVTADVLAWGAITAANGGLQATGALGPISAFGLDAVEQGCKLAGMSRLGANSTR